MGHTHSEDQSAFYVDQLCTVGVCAGLGVVAVLLWRQDMLKVMLAPRFHLPVVLGGVTLLVLAAVRGVVLWASAARSRAAREAGDERQHALAHQHVHEHEHQHECGEAADGHAHAEGHDCGHHHHEEGDGCCAGGHDHGWGFWRYLVLMVPVALFVLHMPDQGFRSIGDADVGGLEQAHAVQDKGGEVIDLQFRELDRAASSAESRSFYEGRTGRLKGQFAPSPGDDRMFGLVRYKMTCCAADAIPLQVVIAAPAPVTRVGRLDWVEVEGQIQFRERTEGKGEYVPVLQVASNDKIRKTNPDSNPFIQ